VQNGKNILNPFLLGRVVLVIENHVCVSGAELFLEPVLTAVPGNKLKSKAAEAVFIGDHKCADISCTDSFQ
jgi:Na+-transporting NADH:ubiquinone oxidoreductase subunit NqrB